MIRYVKFFLNSLLVLLISNSSFAQAKLRDDILPHSPEAAAFEKYIETPVTLYTGLPGVSIPVYDIKSGSLSVPMQLSYNYSGYRPAEEATRVGLGWTLNAGGCITRIVKGSVDASPFIDIKYDDFVDIMPLSTKQKYLKLSAEGYFDTEPDLYTFNFSGYSGKFLWVGGEAVMVPHQDLKIKRAGSFGQEFFTITTPEGVVYTFDIGDTTEQRHFGPGTPATPTHTSAWFLGKIQSADKLHTVDFSYTDYIYEPRSQYSYQFTETRAEGQGGSTTSYSAIGSNFPSIHSKQLTGISWDDYTVIFEEEEESRQDLLNNSSHALKSIHISNGQTVVKNINFSQIYVGGNTTPTKMLLKQVEITTMPTDANGNFTEGSKSAGKYLFDYEQENGFFPVNASIDYGNYCNGPGTVSSLFPCGFIPASLMPPCGNRNPDLNATMMGALRKVTYPTGGYTTFEYEQNTVPGSDPQPVAKVAQLDFAYLTPGIDPPPLTREIPFELQYDQTVTFNYGRILPSGVPAENNDVPIMKISTQQASGTDYTGRLLYRNEPSFSGSLFLPAGHYILEATCQNNFAEVFAHVHYTLPGTYTDKAAPGLRVKKITSYDNLNQAKPSLVKKLFYQDASGTHSSGILLAGPTIGHQKIENKPAYELGGSAPPSETHIFSAEASSPINSLIDVPFYYTRVTEVNGDETINGKTISQFQNSASDGAGVDLIKRSDLKYAAGNFFPVKEQVYDYTITNKRTCGFWRAQVSGTGLGFSNPDMQDASSRETFYQAVDAGVVRSSYKVLTQTREISYDENGQNPYTKEVNYEYSNPLHHFPTAKIENNDRGETIRTEMKYPLDYDLNECDNPDEVENLFNAAVSNALTTYYTCSNQRAQALLTPVLLQPYYPNSITNEAQFTSIVNSFPCEEDLENASPAIWAARNSGMNTYASCIMNLYISETSPEKKAIWLMKKNHIISPVLEQYVSINKSGTDYMLSAVKTDYAVKLGAASYDIPVPAVIKQVEAGNLNLTKNAFTAAPDNYYKPEIYFVYDANNNLVEQHKQNNMPVSYLWDYHNQHPVAEVINADKEDIFAYNSFEAENKNGFTFDGTIEQDLPAILKPAAEVSSITGNHYYMLEESHKLDADLNQEVTYVVSLWKKGVGNVRVNGTLPQVQGRAVGEWHYCEWRISNYTKLTISGAGIPVDEVRLYPAKAHMNTYTYSPGKGIRDKCDINNRINYYYYDGIGRLQLIRNQDKNVLKKFCYNYAGEPSECGSGEPAVFENNQLIRNYRKNCGPGNFVPCSITFEVPGGMFTSAISQEDADSLALDYANNTGQNTADNNTACTCTAIEPVTIKANNGTSLQNFAVTFKNVTTGTEKLFNISSLSGLRTLGTVDSGIYNITVERYGYLGSYTYSLNCNSLTIEGRSATFYNINISSASCNVIAMSVGVQ